MSMLWDRIMLFSPPPHPELAQLYREDGIDGNINKNGFAGLQGNGVVSQMKWYAGVPVACYGQKPWELIPVKIEGCGIIKSCVCWLSHGETLRWGTEADIKAFGFHRTVSFCWAVKWWYGSYPGVDTEVKDTRSQQKSSICGCVCRHGFGEGT